MRHDVTRPNRNEISSTHDTSRGESISVTRRNLFNQR
jgi:hypothetical protein